jgi:hypothetical protein
MAGITRVHSGLYAPKNFSGVGLQDFTLKFWAGDNAAVWTDFNGTAVAGLPTANTLNTGSVAGGAFDQIFRTAVTQFGSLSRVGYLDTTTNAYYTMKFAIESLGVDAFSPTGLGLGSVEGTTASTTEAALTAAVQSLGTGPNANIHLSSATVVAFYY